MELEPPPPPFNNSVMKKYYLKPAFYSIMLLFAIGITACKKNGEKIDSDLTITFQTRINGNNFGLYETYRNASDIDIKFELFQFYLSDITIINSDGDSRLVSEIALFRFNASGLSTLNFEVPRGNYESIQFGIGVKKELNEADPSNYAIEGHPLNTIENTYWGWAGMYRFITSEGRFDSDLNGEFEGTFAYHTGREVSYRTLTLDHQFEIKKKDENTLFLAIDLYQLLDRTGNEIDVLTEPYYHGSTETESITIRISDNMSNAISIIEE